MSNPALVDDVKAMATLVSALVDYTGDFDIPVVNIHFDLGVLDAVEDPQDLKREEEELLKYVFGVSRLSACSCSLYQNHARREREDGKGWDATTLPKDITTLG